MYRRTYLQIPGPTNIPQPILSALQRPAINHRGTDFAAIMRDNELGLKEILKTHNDVLVFPSSGTGGLEAAIVNMLSPGDKVINANMGVFSERFGDIARKFGAHVTTLEVDWGMPLTSAQLYDALVKDTAKEYKAILVTHNETSTGVTTDIAAIRAVLDVLDHPAMLMVDAISSLGISDLPTDALRIDVVVSASQKGLMLPGGLAIVCVSDKAWAAHREAQMPRWYWDFTSYKQKSILGQVPYTPAISLFFGLEAALKLIREEGLQNMFTRHYNNAQAVQRGVLSLGLQLLVKEEKARSSAVTAVMLPSTFSYTELSALMHGYGVVIGGGLKRLENHIFRIGHLGMLHDLDVIAILAALEMSLTKLHYPLELGTAVRRAQECYMQDRVKD